MNIEEIKKYFKEKSNSSSIGHAYLFSNTNYENIKSVIEFVLCSIIYKSNIDIEENSDIYILEPEKNVIKKEKVLELEKKISKTSQISNNKVYIIKECDKLNLSAANCLLKTLEEPAENVYAFLITSNIDSVISTIRSRCQIIKCKTCDSKFFDKEFVEKTISIIKMLEESKHDLIVYKSNELYKSIEKNDYKLILNMIELFYKDCLNKIYELNIEYFIDYKELISIVVERNDYKKIISKIKILNDNIDLLKYNLNMNLFVDKLLIEFRRL